MTAFIAKLKKPWSIALVAVLMLVSPPGLASIEAGPGVADHFFGNAAPIVLNQNLAQKTREIDYEEFSVLHSGVSRTPLWSAEHLSALQVEAARVLKRRNAFHADPQLPLDERAELSDYARSGYDRGHMAPSGDMPTEVAQQESFSLANMVPQDPRNNQTLWQAIEEATRAEAEHDGELYVVTGPLFEGQALERINGRVLVPTAVFKAIYNPAIRQGAAYVTPNAPGMEYQTLSIADLEKRSGINLFPAVPRSVKSVKMRLPPPVARGGRSRHPPIEVETLPRKAR